MAEDSSCMGKLREGNCRPVLPSGKIPINTLRLRDPDTASRREAYYTTLTECTAIFYNGTILQWTTKALTVLSEIVGDSGRTLFREQEMIARANRIHCV